MFKKFYDFCVKRTYICFMALFNKNNTIFFFWNIHKNRVNKKGYKINALYFFCFWMTDGAQNTLKFLTTVRIM